MCTECNGCDVTNCACACHVFVGPMVQVLNKPDYEKLAEEALAYSDGSLYRLADWLARHDPQHQLGEPWHDHTKP